MVFKFEVDFWIMTLCFEFYFWLAIVSHLLVLFCNLSGYSFDLLQKKIVVSLLVTIKKYMVLILLIAVQKNKEV